MKSNFRKFLEFILFCLFIGLILGSMFIAFDSGLEDLCKWEEVNSKIGQGLL